MEGDEHSYLPPNEPGLQWPCREQGSEERRGVIISEFPHVLVDMLNDTSDYRSLFLSGAPLIDTRAPIEFKKGAFPGAVNLPLMNDLEREKVGTCYRKQGGDAALALGHQLVSGPVKEQRVAAWADFARQHPDGYLYCFRGGLRSAISQTWLKELAGIDYPRVTGGYKAMRGFLLETMEHAAVECSYLVLGGMTGTGKTDLLQQLHNALDLEDHAHHRGSSFGRHVDEQRTQIDFENRLAIDMLKKRDAGIDRFVVEDEAQFIGHCSVPASLYSRMATAPVIWLEDTLERRVQRILRDYVVNLCQGFADRYGADAGFAPFAQRLHQSLDRIQKRLGHQRHAQLAAIMDSALAEQSRTGNVEGHREWIYTLLVEYYDPMYNHQRQEKAARIVFSGDEEAVLAYLQGRSVA